ncbi:MAG: NADAR family protein [Cytophagales bacterium]|nr:MAG: NADAR family protein [Cytophagales bacterium]
MEKQKPILFNENPPPKNINGLYDYVVHNEEKICGFFGKYFFLSNGKKCEIQDEENPNIIYQYSENAYQASKFENINIRQQFQNINFKDAIHLAWELKKHIRIDWGSIKTQKMKSILTQKFQNPTLQTPLQETQNKYLEETNHWKDTFWGVCDGIGENILGKILMEIRKENRHKMML